MSDEQPMQTDAVGVDAADDLDGHTLDELADYLDASRYPLDPDIEGSPACRNALTALERLRDVTRQLAQEDVEAETARDERWISNILAAINVNARAGKDIPLSASPGDGAVVLTEGALRSLLRGAGDRVPGLLVGRVRFGGDLLDPGSPLTVRLSVTIVEGFPIPESVADLRTSVLAEVLRHTEHTVAGIDVAVTDLQPLADFGRDADR